MSLWVKSSSTGGATLVHSSTAVDGTGWCIDYLGFSSTGQIVATGWGYGDAYQLIGPTIQPNNWTHISTTYSRTNGLRLYVNGFFIGSSGSRGNEGSRSSHILTLGNSIQGIPQSSPGGNCNSQSIDPSVYYGSIDEFRVYAKELTAAEVWILSNP